MTLKTIKEIKERYIIFFDNGKNATAIATDIEEAIQLEKELHPKWNIISASWCGSKINY